MKKNYLVFVINVLIFLSYSKWIKTSTNNCGRKRKTYIKQVKKPSYNGCGTSKKF